MSQKNSTKEKTIKLKEKKKKTRRQKAKYPALNKSLNLKLRKDYIEPDYVGGVKNDQGELVIRALNDEEKQFLNDFYEESVGANFLHDDELKDINDEIKALKAQLKDTENPDIEIQERLDYYSMLLYDRRDEVLIYPDEDDHRKIYGENNARNRCIFNRSKAAGSMVDIDTERLDEREESNDYIDPETGRNILFDKQELFDKYPKDED